MSIDVEEVRRWHASTRMKRCRWCTESWPCIPLKMADEIEALRSQLLRCGETSWAGETCVLPPAHQNYHASADGICWTPAPVLPEPGRESS